MGDHQGCQVAVKVLRVYLTSDFEKITKVGCSYSVLDTCASELTVTHVEVLQGSYDMEKPLPSECVATPGGDDE